jgi:hypothetical protein
LLVSLILATAYGIAFKNLFGSPKEKRLSEEVETMRLKYKLLEQDIRQIEKELGEIAAAEDNIYRPVLDLDEIA